MNTIIELLDLLKAKGWRDVDIAYALDVDRITVYRWRNGQQPANEVMLRNSLNQLLRRAGPPRRGKDLAGAAPARQHSLR
jgi:hypothetical protein